jgi:hypothetical protein
MKRQPVQLANEFRAKHNQLNIERNNPVERKARHRVINQLTIDRLLLEGKIDHDQWNVAEKILKYGHAGGMAGGVLESNLSKLVVIDGSTSEKLTFQYDARDKLRSILVGIDKAGGNSRLTFMVCVEDYSPTSASKILKITKPLPLLSLSLSAAMNLVYGQ